MKILFDDVEYYKINGFNYYYISKNGKIYSTSKRGIKKTLIDPQGYEKVGLCTDKGLKTIRCRVHELMALTFLDEKYKTKNLQVNHIDGDKSNSKLSNLEIVTPKENTIHSVNNKLSSMYKFIDVIGINDNASIFVKRLKLLSYYKFDRKRVAKAIKTKTPYKGYYWYMYEEFTNCYT